MNDHDHNHDAGVGAGATEPEGRFGHLVYTSDDSGSGPGGWGVKDNQGGLTAAEAAALTSRIPSGINWVEPIPRTAGRAEKAALPRRLAHACLDGLGSALWHTTPAGTDDSGRPNNAFTQALLDRDPAAADDPFRPTDVWRSADWLVPFNANEVGQARLAGPERPVPGELARVDAILDFVLDAEASPPRDFVLPCLLDAAVAAREGGATLVLGVGDGEEGARWIATVLCLMSPAVARTIGFSTFERASTVRRAADDGLHILCVPREDLAEITPRDGLVLLDVGADQQLNGDGSAHLAYGGAHVAVTDFSRVAGAVLDDRAFALRVFRTLDASFDGLGEAGLAPALPSAVALLTHTRDLLPQEAEGFAEARAAAARIVLATSPPGATGEILAALETALGLWDGTASEAARAVARVDPARSGDVGRRLVQSYVELALADPAYLRGQVLLPPQVLDGAAPEADGLRAAVDALWRTATARDDTGGDPISAATEVLHAHDIVASAGLLDGDRAAYVTERFVDLFQHSVVGHLIADPGATAFVGAVGPVTEATGALLRELVAPADAPAAPSAARLPAATLDWLSITPPEPPTVVRVSAIPAVVPVFAPPAAVPVFAPPTAVPVFAPPTAVPVDAPPVDGEDDAPWARGDATQFVSLAGPEPSGVPVETSARPRATPSPSARAVVDLLSYVPEPVLARGLLGPEATALAGAAWIAAVLADDLPDDARVSFLAARVRRPTYGDDTVDLLLDMVPAARLVAGALLGLPEVSERLVAPGDVRNLAGIRVAGSPVLVAAVDRLRGEGRLPAESDVAGEAEELLRRDGGQAPPPHELIDMIHRAIPAKSDERPPSIAPATPRGAGAAPPPSADAPLFPRYDAGGER